MQLLPLVMSAVMAVAAPAGVRPLLLWSVTCTGPSRLRIAAANLDADRVRSLRRREISRARSPIWSPPSNDRTSSPTSSCAPPATVDGGG